MEKKDIFPIAIGLFGLGASRSESWEDNNRELEVDWQDNGGIPIYKFANQVE